MFLAVSENFSKSSSSSSYSLIQKTVKLQLLLQYACSIDKYEYEYKNEYKHS